MTDIAPSGLRRRRPIIPGKAQIDEAVALAVRHSRQRRLAGSARRQVGAGAIGAHPEPGVEYFPPEQPLIRRDRDRMPQQRDPAVAALDLNFQGPQTRAIAPDRRDLGSKELRAASVALAVGDLLGIERTAIDPQRPGAFSNNRHGQPLVCDDPDSRAGFSDHRRLAAAFVERQPNREHRVLPQARTARIGDIRFQLQLAPQYRRVELVEEASPDAVEQPVDLGCVVGRQQIEGPAFERLAVEIGADQAVRRLQRP
jgi:hypothetical protein